MAPADLSERIATPPFLPHSAGAASAAPQSYEAGARTEPSFSAELTLCRLRRRSGAAHWAARVAVRLADVRLQVGRALMRLISRSPLVRDAKLASLRGLFSAAGIPPRGKQG